MNALLPSNLLALVALAVLPALAYLLVVRWLDRYDREPWSHVVGAFLWGATGAVFLGGIGTLILQVPLTLAVGAEAIPLLQIVVLAPITEELAKFVFLLAISTQLEFDGMIDGMVYGAAVGLGFAAVENFLYFTRFAGSAPQMLGGLILLRTIFTMVGHGVATSCAGAALGAAKFSSAHPAARLGMVLAGLLVAMGLHALGNGILVASQALKAPGMVLVDLAGLVFALGVNMLIMQVELSREAELIRRELGSERAAGRLEEGEVALVASYLARLRRQLWLVLTLDWGKALRVHRFCRLATSLALRIAQARERENLQPAVERLRAELAALKAEGAVL